MWRCCSIISVLKPYHHHHRCYFNYGFQSQSHCCSFSSATFINVSRTGGASMTTLTEPDVGILCFISQLPGFRGIIKQRYSDFIVNEVDTDGNVVHLTSLDAPHEPAEVVKEEERKISMKNPDDYALEIEAFRSLSDDSDTQKLENFLNQIKSGSENDVSPIVLSPDSDKAHRTKVHNFFKENFKFLVTDTIDGPDALSKCIRVRLSSENKKGRNSRKRKGRDDKPFDSRGSKSWPENMGKFLRFHLYKENKDTQEVLGIIGKMLGIQPRSFGFAGTKDKRSVSTQRVTVFKQQAGRLATLNERLIGIKVGNFCYVDEELLLGKLLGNRFTVTLRGVSADSEATIRACADSLGKQGFINYFGLQAQLSVAHTLYALLEKTIFSRLDCSAKFPGRFGSGSVPTHLVGATLLRGEWKDAVSMILNPREGERNVISEAREYYKETGDIEGTLKQLPRHLVAERAMLQCLRKAPGNYLQALKAIPRTLRMMYVHSYQSYLWNYAASMRVQQYGTNKVVLGDLVLCKKDVAENLIMPVPAETADESFETYECSQLNDISSSDLPELKDNLVKVVTAEDISAGKYAIEDVVLPMPGSRVKLPENAIADVFHEKAKKDSINLLESVHNVKEFSITSMTGSYRRVFQKPMDFEWELLTYTDANVPLAETDLEKIAKSKAMNTIEGVKQDNGTETSVACEDHDPEHAHDSVVDENAQQLGERQPAFQQSLPASDFMERQKALKLGFTLPSSCYATMAIRELLKTSTSVAFHKTLN